MVRCVSTPGEVVPFQFTQHALIAKLSRGGGSELPKDKAVEFGNYKVLGDEDGGAMASMDFKFTKTSRHKDGGNYKSVFTGEGLETHFLPSGDVVYLPERSFGDRGLVLAAWEEPVVATRREASDALVDEEDRIQD